MNNAKLAQATLLALTMQNQAQKVAPLSTTLMEGLVINRNIGIGDTVCCYYNDDGSLLRMGDIPNHSSSFFVDENSLMYDYVSSANVLRTRDGLSGILIGETTAYEFKVCNNCCAFRVSSNAEDNIWRFITPKGTISEPITIPVATSPVGNPPYFAAGYRNGVLAIVKPMYSGGDWNRYDVFTYSPSGALLSQLTSYQGGIATRNEIVCPINANAVNVLTEFDTGGIYDFIGYLAFVSTNEGITRYYPWSEYNINRVSGNFQDSRIARIGVDGSYMYTEARLVDPEDHSQYLDTRIVLRWSIDNPPVDGLGAEEVDRYEDEREYFCANEGNTSPWGKVMRVRTVNGEQIQEMMDLSIWQVIYPEYFTEAFTGTPSQLPTSIIQENAGYIWVEEFGVYRKTPIGWLMYPTSVYPKSSPWGKLGYAIRYSKVGDTGIAVQLFE